MEVGIKEILYVLTLAISVGIAYGMMKATIKNNKERLDDIKEEFHKRDDIVEEKVEKIDREFKKLFHQTNTKIEELRQKIERLESVVSKALDHDTAEKKFVTQRELELQMQNINMRIISIEKSMNSMDKKIDAILDYLKGCKSCDIAK